MDFHDELQVNTLHNYFGVIYSLGSCAGSKPILGTIGENGKTYTAYDRLFAIESTALGDTNYYSFSEGRIAEDVDSLYYSLAYGISIRSSMGLVVHKCYLETNEHLDKLEISLDKNSNSYEIVYQNSYKKDATRFDVRAYQVYPKRSVVKEHYTIMLFVVANNPEFQISLDYVTADFIEGVPWSMNEWIAICEKSLLTLFNGVDLNMEKYQLIRSN